MEDTGKVAVNGERGSLMAHEQNGVLVSSPLSGGRREIASRSFSGMKPIGNDDIDLEGGKETKDRDKTIRSNRPVKIQNQALLSGLAYCVSSCSMILVNKFVLSSYKFNAGISLMLYQNLVSVVIVSVLSFFGTISTEPLTWRLICVWLPVNFIFVGMLITSMFSLKYINVAMVTVLKNVTNVITALGEMYLFKKHHDSRVWAALVLMIISAISGGITDITFHAVGYTWQLINCFLTASYSLTLRRVMDTAKQVTKSGNLNEFSMVLLNNVLSLPLGLLLMFVFNEVDYLSKTAFYMDFVSQACISGFSCIVRGLILVGKLQNTMNCQAALEDAHVLVGDDIKWVLRPCHQLHFNVVSSSDGCYYIQPGRIIKQDSPLHRWNPSIQSSNQSGELDEHPFWAFGWGVFRESQNDGEILSPPFISMLLKTVGGEMPGCLPAM